MVFKPILQQPTPEDTDEVVAVRAAATPRAVAAVHLLERQEYNTEDRAKLIWTYGGNGLHACALQANIRLVSGRATTSHTPLRNPGPEAVSRKNPNSRNREDSGTPKGTRCGGVQTDSPGIVLPAGVAAATVSTSKHDQDCLAMPCRQPTMLHSLSYIT